MISVENLGFACKETLCSKCAHRCVCSHVEEFMIIQEAVDNLTITTPEGIENVKVSELPWVKAIEPQCVFYSRNESAIRGAISVHSVTDAF